VITYNRIMTAGLVIWAAWIFLLPCSLWSSVGAASVGVSPEGPRWCAQSARAQKNLVPDHANGLRPWGGRTRTVSRRVVDLDPT
jgi:hypothetical protein